MEYQGRVFKILPPVSGKKSDGDIWRRQEFVFEFFQKPEQTYSDKVVITLFGDRIDEYKLQHGDELLIDLTFNFREFNGRLYNEPYARSLRKLRSLTPTNEENATAATEEAPAVTQQKPAEEPGQDGADDLPF